MMKETITVKRVYGPDGKKPGTVYDTQDRKWKIWGSDFSGNDFREGATYDIGYKPGTYNGKPDNVIETKQDVTGSQLAAPPATNGNGHDRERNIYICGITNKAVEIGKADPFSPADLTAIRKAATAAFEACP